ncbi:MAG: flagellar basal body P-ring formation protein FlgA [Planctomycetaceae bacterium]|nr:flagellar basal body P-ring formation protein FlgA [Planctomycetaceae bacterium]
MTLRAHILLVVVVALFASVTAVRAAELQASGLVVVTLRSDVDHHSRLIRVGDIALISGGSAAARQRIADLDLVELDLAEPSIEISQTLVEARLLLNGVPPGAFRINGAEAAAVVRRQAQSNEERVLDVVRSAVAEELALDANEIIVQLAQPLTAELARMVQATPEGELAARLPSTAGGRTRIDLWISEDRGGQRQTAIVVNVRFRQLTPVIVRPLAARHVLTEADVAMEMRDLTQRGVALTLDQVTGKSLRRSLIAGEIVVEKDLFAPVSEDDPVVVKPRDMVRVTARKGKLRLEMPSAEAMQAGRLGETVRVKNPITGRIIIARVVGSGEVEVPL